MTETCANPAHTEASTLRCAKPQHRPHTSSGRLLVPRIGVVQGEDDKDGRAAAIWTFRTAKDGDPLATWDRATALAADLNAALDPKVHA